MVIMQLVPTIIELRAIPGCSLNLSTGATSVILAVVALYMAFPTRRTEWRIKFGRG